MHAFKAEWEEQGRALSAAADPGPAAVPQVVTEAADACACAMLAACPSQRLLPKLLSTLAADKNGRLRQAAADYLLVALECWDPADWERQLEAVEKTVLAAAAEAQAETRATARALFVAYARAAPAAAAAALARLRERDRALYEKLAAAVAAAREREPGERQATAWALPPGLATASCVLPRTVLTFWLVGRAGCGAASLAQRKMFSAKVFEKVST